MLLYVNGSNGIGVMLLLIGYGFFRYYYYCSKMVLNIVDIEVFFGIYKWDVCFVVFWFLC